MVSDVDEQDIQSEAKGLKSPDYLLLGSCMKLNREKRLTHFDGLREASCPSRDRSVEIGLKHGLNHTRVPSLGSQAMNEY